MQNSGNSISMMRRASRVCPSMAQPAAPAPPRPTALPEAGAAAAVGVGHHHVARLQGINRRDLLAIRLVRPLVDVSGHHRVGASKPICGLSGRRRSSIAWLRESNGIEDVGHHRHVEVVAHDIEQPVLLSTCCVVQFHPPHLRIVHDSYRSH